MIIWKIAIIYCLIIWGIMGWSVWSMTESALARLWVVFISPITYPGYLLSYLWDLVRFRKYIKFLANMWGEAEAQNTILVEDLIGLRGLVGSQVCNHSYIKFPAPVTLCMTQTLEICCNNTVIDLSDVTFETNILPAIRLIGKQNCIINPNFVYTKSDLDIYAVKPVATPEGVADGLICLVECPPDSNTLLMGLCLSLKDQDA